MNRRQVDTAAKHMAAAGITVLGSDENGDSRYAGPYRLIVLNPATRRRLYYQSYEWAMSAASWHRGVCRRLVPDVRA